MKWQLAQMKGVEESSLQTRDLHGLGKAAKKADSND